MGGGGSTKYRYIKYCVFIKYVYSDSCRNSLKLNFFSIFFKVTLSPTFFFFFAIFDFVSGLLRESDDDDDDEEV